MRMPRRAACAALLAGLCGAAGATTVVVLPDGSGDHSTIQAAIDATQAGDVVELADGVYTGAGNRDIEFPGWPITVRSASGQPESCIIDCQGSSADPHRGFIVWNGSHGLPSTLEGITVTGGWAPAGESYTGDKGGGVLIFLQELLASRCIFRGNRAAGEGGGVYCRGAQSLTDCRFESNTADAGSAWCGVWSNAEFSDCVFAGNDAETRGAVACDGSILLEGCLFQQNAGGALLYIGLDFEVLDCTFTRNSSDQGGAIYAWPGGGIIHGCTFWGNEAGAGGAIRLYGVPSFPIENCLFASGDGPAITLEGGGCPALSCCDIHGHDGGDWVGCLADQLGQNGNICLDPQFCSEAPGEDLNWTLQSDSPCSAEQSGCGPIGAWRVGCATTEVRERTWGGLKLLFRGS